MDRDELLAWALLARTYGLNHEHVTAALAAVANATDLVRCKDGQLARLGLPESARQCLRNPDWKQVEADVRWLEQSDRHLLPLTSALYPPLLAESGGAPVALYVRGEPRALTLPQLAIVGSRKPTAGGRDTARQFSDYLSGCGLTITSGLAEGIDAAAHEGALAAGGLTIAVCGTGLGQVYPPQHAALAERIAAQGALVAEFPPDMGVRRENFPRRNRIISGLSLGVLVVEAARQSGSLITARRAAEQGREVFAIPGSIHNPMSRGCHQLIRDGARLVETAADILGELRVALSAATDTPGHAATAQPTPAMDSEYRLLLDALAFDPVDLDTLVRRSGLKAEAVASMLLILELRGEVETRPGGRYCRAAQRSTPAIPTRKQ
jgi:DNA processing protein